ncbi:MAG: DinB family protein [Nitrososphaerales archaeon]
MEIRELYRYSSTVRRKFLDKLGTLPWDQVVEDREASFHSMRNIMVHMIDNEDWIVNWQLSDRSVPARRAKPEDFDSVQAMRDYLDGVERRTRAYLDGADEKELGRRVKFTLSSGTAFDLSVEECLFQSFTEQLYHLGELIALLWQEDVEPPTMQWFWNNPRIAP